MEKRPIFEPETSMWDGALDLLPEFKLNPGSSAFLVVDMQYLDAHPDFGMGRRAKETGTFEQFSYYFRTIKEIIPRISALQKICRERRLDVMFAKIACYLKDCRDVSPQHKRVNFYAPPGSREAEILEELAPLEDELILIKGCSGVFNSTAIDQILRNMGIDTLIICGVTTDGCVGNAVRDASDRGYHVILVGDACATVSPEDHAFGLRCVNNAACKVMTTQQVIDLIVAAEARPEAASRNVG
jgi:nicotinamidase-related amidase